MTRAVRHVYTEFVCCPGVEGVRRQLKYAWVLVGIACRGRRGEDLVLDFRWRPSVNECSFCVELADIQAFAVDKDGSDSCFSDRG